MLPGPNEPYPEIMDELKNGVIPHYGDAWNEILPKTCEEMKAIFQTSKSDVVIWPMSGSSAHKFVASNIVEKGDKIISLNNGRFGELFEDKIMTSGGEVVKVESEYGKSIDHYAFMVLIAMIVTSGFIQIGYILGQAALDKYTAVAQTALERDKIVAANQPKVLKTEVKESPLGSDTDDFDGTL